MATSDEDKFTSEKAEASPPGDDGPATLTSDMRGRMDEAAAALTSFEILAKQAALLKPGTMTQVRKDAGAWKQAVLLRVEGAWVVWRVLGEAADTVVSVDNAEGWEMGGAVTQDSGTRRPREDRLWRLSCSVPRGADMQDLRARCFELAGYNCAFAPNPPTSIVYSAPVSAASNLQIELYFTARQFADKMFNDVRRTVRHVCRRVDVVPMGRVFSDGDSSMSMDQLLIVDDAAFDTDVAPHLTSFDSDESLETSSHKTVVLDEDEIKRESVVDPEKVILKFERSHIDATVKRTRADTTGNHIPLPSDWRRYFDGDTTTHVAPISVVAPPEERGTAPSEADGRSPVVVHVYFLPSFLHASAYASSLRDARPVRPNVFSVTVWKCEPQLYVAKLRARHDTITQKWGRVP
jgi:hypothetical protein